MWTMSASQPSIWIVYQFNEKQEQYIWRKDDPNFKQLYEKDRQSSKSILVLFQRVIIWSKVISRSNFCRIFAMLFKKLNDFNNLLKSHKWSKLKNANISHVKRT